MGPVIITDIITDWW